ncbi:hypothetical protein MHYP_G00300480 [Metynnis hypsauchen]
MPARKNAFSMRMRYVLLNAFRQCRLFAPYVAFIDCGGCAMSPIRLRHIVFSGLFCSCRGFTRALVLVREREATWAPVSIQNQEGNLDRYHRSLPILQAPLGRLLLLFRRDESLPCNENDIGSCLKRKDRQMD